MSRLLWHGLGITVTCAVVAFAMIAVLHRSSDWWIGWFIGTSVASTLSYLVGWHDRAEVPA